MTRAFPLLLVAALLGVATAPAMAPQRAGAASGGVGRAFCPPAPALAACASARIAASIPWKRGHEPLDKLLRSIARRAFVPMSIVLAEPVPAIELPGRSLAPAALLDRVVRGHREYRWGLDRGVLCFDDVRVTADRNNFLNWRLYSFTIARNLGDDKIVLAELLSILPKRPINGLALEGLYATIAGHPARATLRGATGRAILLHLLRAAPTFYSQIVFPAAGPITHGQAIQAIGGWQWIPLTQPPIPPPPKPCGPVKVPPGAGPNWRPPPSEACPPVPHR